MKQVQNHSKTPWQAVLTVLVAFLIAVLVVPIITIDWRCDANTRAISDLELLWLSHGADVRLPYGGRDLRIYERDGVLYCNQDGQEIEIMYYDDATRQWIPASINNGCDE